MSDQKMNYLRLEAFLVRVLFINRRTRYSYNEREKLLCCTRRCTNKMEIESNLNKFRLYQLSKLYAVKKSYDADWRSSNDQCNI